jgi:4-diphosphocytidyl-2-C-methyl-D-erythritol kinase
MDEITILANAKINLALAVKYRRADGFHELESIFQEIDFADRLRIRKSEGVRFRSNLDFLAMDPTNLCTAAARLIMETFGVSGLEIELDKRIPIGAGLGGGSSDAAAVLKAAVQLYDLPVEIEDLHPLAERLGSDVPFFLTGGSAWVTGRGEIIQPISTGTDYQLVLVLPDIRISTAWAYKNLNLDLTKKGHEYKFRGFKFHEIAVTDFRKSYFNDFEESVFSVHPALRDIKQKLYDAGADFAAMSGSGSTMFGVFESVSRAREAGEKLRPVYEVRLVRPVSG